MRLFIASDLHGSAAQAARMRDKIDELKPDAVLFLGDILYHGPRNSLPEGYAPAEAAEILEAIKIPVIAVRGNCDSEVDELVLPFALTETAWLWEGDRPFLALHGHGLPECGGFFKIPDVPVIIFGHLHRPIAEKREDGVRYWNPGSLSLPKGGLPPSFGFYENGRFEVRSFQGGTLAADAL